MFHALQTVIIATLALPGLTKIPLYIGAFFPMSSMNYNGWTGGKGIQPAAEIALEHVNNSGVLDEYEMKMLWNDTRGSPGWTEHLLFQFLSTLPRKVMLLGAGYSSCSTVVAAMAGLTPWQIPQISYASTSPELSNKDFYPYFYRTIPDDTSFNAPRIALLQTYNWSYVAIIYQEENIHRAAVQHLQEEFSSDGIEQIAAEGFRDSAVTQMSKLKSKDARIIIGNFFGRGARKVFCEAYKLGMYGARYMWILLGYIEKDWWLVNDTSVQCTADQMLRAANYHLSTDNLWQANQKLATTSGKTVKQISNEYNSKVEPSKRDEHSNYAYDAVWAMALALNRTLSRMPGKRLKILPYGSNEYISVLREELDKINFIGVTGPVAFTAKGNRVGDTRINQFINGKQISVGLYSNQHNLINWTGHNKVVWQGDSPPFDRIRRVYRTESLSFPLYVFMVIVAFFCVLVALFFLWFNTKYRHVRYIKMSSPNLNDIIILGCVLNYISVVTFGLDGTLVNDGYNIICASRAWTLSLGFSLACGAMFSKTWRVHTIFTNRKLRGKIVKDRHLFAIVFLLVIVDVTYLTVWQFIDPLKQVVYDSHVETLSTNLDVEVIVRLEYCESTTTYRWLGILFGYKGLLLLFGAFLAWETRKVTIAALNDSKYIGFSVYNVFVLCLIGIPVSLVLRDQPDASFSIVATIIIFATSLTLGFVFIPKVIELRKSMSVGGQERMERTFTVGTLAHNNLYDSGSTLHNQNLRELNECKHTLQEKEIEIENLRKCLRVYQTRSNLTKSTNRENKPKNNNTKTL